MVWGALAFVGMIAFAALMPRRLLRFYSDLVEVHYPIREGHLFDIAQRRIYTRGWLATAIVGGLLVALGFWVEDVPWIAMVAIPVGVGVICADAIARTYRLCHASLRSLGFSWPPRNPIE